MLQGVSESGLGQLFRNLLTAFLDAEAFETIVEKEQPTMRSKIYDALVQNRKLGVRLLMKRWNTSMLLMMMQPLSTWRHLHYVKIPFVSRLCLRFNDCIKGPKCFLTTL